jgi:Xaa-Pro aminopeptidase
VARLAGELRERELDGLLVLDATNLRYLTGFNGTNGLALIAAGTAEGSPVEGHRFLTDFRYVTQWSEQAPPQFELEAVADDLLEALSRTLATFGDSSPGESPDAKVAAPPANGRGRLGFDDATLTVSQHARLRDLLAGWELVPFAGAVERLRAVKDDEELARIREAAELADQALSGVLEDGVVGRAERDVAIELELRMRRLGAEGPSFPSIVAAGAQAALPHAPPRAEPIPENVLLTIDWGAQHEGYCSDCTRTFATGERISTEAREVYELVLDAQQQALAAVEAGPSGRELDRVARGVIERAGRGERFGHGLGHGVGLDVHEAPRLSRTASEEPLRAGNVVTIEPGVYLPGRLGVRIEDLVVVADAGHEVLTGLSKELTVIA